MESDNYRDVDVRKEEGEFWSFGKFRRALASRSRALRRQAEPQANRDLEDDGVETQVIRLLGIFE